MTDKNPIQTISARLLGGDRSGAGIVYIPIKTNKDGSLYTVIVSSDGQEAGIAGVGPASDSLFNTNAGLHTITFNELFNGSTWDRERNNTEETVLASAARTATVNSADFTNYNAKGLHVIVNVTVATGGPSIIPFIQGKDPVSGTYYDILEGLPITTTGINIIKVFPGISAVVNSSASDILPRTWRVRVTHADTKSITYSVAGALVL